MEFTGTEKYVYPISYAIPKKKIIKSINKNPKNILSPLVPGKLNTYVYENENDYHQMYQDSIFSLTYRKQAWDSLRHYEILANGSIPMFIQLKDCPSSCLTTLPKKELIDFFDLYKKIFRYYNPFQIYKKRFRSFEKLYNYIINIYKKLPEPLSFIEENPKVNEHRNHLLEFTKNNLTSEKLAEYVINTSRIFFK